MKKIFLGLVTIALMSAPAFANGEKNDTKKQQQKVECKKDCDNCCCKGDKCCCKDGKCSDTQYCKGCK